MSGDVEILRGDLCRILYEQTSGDTDYRFGDRITRLDDRGAYVQVEFERGNTEEFDLVVGADGLHSGVRGLAIANERAVLRHRGYRIASFALKNPLPEHRGTACYSEPGRGVCLSGFSASEARALLVSSDGPFGPGERIPNDKRRSRRTLCGHGLACTGVPRGPRARPSICMWMPSPPCISSATRAGASPCSATRHGVAHSAAKARRSRLSELTYSRTSSPHNRTPFLPSRATRPPCAPMQRVASPALPTRAPSSHRERASGSRYVTCSIACSAHRACPACLSEWSNTRPAILRYPSTRADGRKSLMGSLVKPAKGRFEYDRRSLAEGTLVRYPSDCQLMPTDPGQAAERIRLTFELVELSEAMLCQRLRRERPGISETEIESLLIEWRQRRPGAEHGDAEGTPVPWPRRS